jgi:hypothetical protein
MEKETLSYEADVLDAGKIQLLVDQGHYSSQEAFLNAAVQEEINKNKVFINEHGHSFNYAMGIKIISKKYLKDTLGKNHRLKIKVVGLLTFADDVSLDLAKRAIEEVKVHGKCIGPKEVKDHFNL